MSSKNHDTSFQSSGNSSSSSAERAAAAASSKPQAKQRVLIEDYAGNTKVRVIKLNDGPVNALNRGLLRELLAALDRVESEAEAWGTEALLLTSNLPNIFTAGLDLVHELYVKNTSREQHHEFWSLLQSVFLRLLNLPLTTFALINGACPAAGCLLSTACDYRIMMKGYTIGLNETQIGLVAPWWFQANFERTIGTRQAEIHLALGSLLPAEEALKLGLVDEVCVSKEDMYSRLDAQLKKWLALDLTGRVMTKQMMRKELTRKLEANREQDCVEAWEGVSSERTQRILSAVIRRLTQKQQRPQTQSKL